MAKAVGHRARAGLGPGAGDPRSEAARRAADAEDADGARLERGPEADGRARAQGQCVCDRPRPSALDRGAAQWRRADRGIDADRGRVRVVFHYAMQATMRRAAALGVSANRITLLRDKRRRRRRRSARRLHGEPQPAVRHGAGRRHLLCRQHRRRDGLSLCRECRSHHRAGQAAHHVQAERPLDAQPARRAPTARSSMPASARSATSPRWAWRSRKAAPRSTSSISPPARIRIFGAGLRNPVGLAWEPNDRVLWTVVNERDGLGDETPPDYLTSVRDGGFYGWPYCYWGKTVDDRVPQDAGDGRQGASRRTTRSAATPLRSACAGCPPARCRAFPTAW